MSLATEPFYEISKSPNAPLDNVVARLVAELHERYQSDSSGSVADYIPELTRADPDWFGICLITADGHQYAKGDAYQPFTIQSVSKAFTYGMVLDDHGIQSVERRIGVEPSGEAFNSISLDPETGRPLNPMINAGAIAATGLVHGRGLEERFERIRQCYSRFAARELEVDEAVYASESATGFRNRAIAHLLRNFEMIDDPVEESVEVYFRQCSILVTCRDLAVMAATLANSGINPITGERALKQENVERVLSVMSTCGMYDYSGSWIFNVGLPAKSGVGGGILGVLPGQVGVAVFSPLLDPKGNSVRGVKVFEELSKRCNLHLFNNPVLSESVIRRTYRLSEVGSRRQRLSSHHQVIRDYGSDVMVVEMQGDLFYSAMERLIRSASQFSTEVSTFIVDLGRVGLTDAATQAGLLGFADEITKAGKRLIIVDPNRVFDWGEFDAGVYRVAFCDEVDVALEKCEDELISQHIAGPMVRGIISFHEFEIFKGFRSKELTLVEGMLEMASYREEETIVTQGDAADRIFLLAKGSVSVYHNPENPQKPARRISAFGPGVCFGDMGVMDVSPRSADVVADEPSTCYTLDTDKIDLIAAEHPETHAKMLQNILLINIARLRRCTKEISSLKE